MAFISKTADKLNGLDAESVVAAIAKTIGVELPFPILEDGVRKAFITRVGKDQSAMVTVVEKSQISLSEDQTADFSDKKQYPISTETVRKLFRELTSMDVPALGNSDVRWGFADNGEAYVNWTETIEEDDIVREDGKLRMKTAEEVANDLQQQIQVSESKAKEAAAQREKLAKDAQKLADLKTQAKQAAAKRSQEEAKLSGGSK